MHPRFSSPRLADLTKEPSVFTTFCTALLSVSLAMDAVKSALIQIAQPARNTTIVMPPGGSRVLEMSTKRRIQAAE
jgi:hypothetical protein